MPTVNWQSLPSISKGEPVPASEIPNMQAMVPGAYERNTLTHRQKGSMGGPAFGSADLPIGPSSLSAATIADREMEGGGGARERRRRIAAHPQTGEAVANASHNGLWIQGVRAWFRLWWRPALNTSSPVVPVPEGLATLRSGGKTGAGGSEKGPRRRQGILRFKQR